MMEQDWFVFVFATVYDKYLHDTLTLKKIIESVHMRFVMAHKLLTYETVSVVVD
jgi:hypothetical protein